MAVKHFESVVVSEISDFQRFRHIHWRAPTVMGAGFLGGLWTIRAGTALAFLSKLWLVVGTGVAYEQWMWVNLHARPQEIGSLNSMFAILSNAFEFLAMRIWWRRPVLGFLAAVTWLLPTSAIITPGTLSVQPVLVLETGTLVVPQRSFTADGNSFCGVIIDGNTTTFDSMSTGLSNPTFATVLSNSVLPLESSSTNLTFDLQFFGPAIRCDMSGSEEFSWAKRAMLEYENMTDTRVFYFSCAPQPGWGPDVNGSFFASTDVQIGNYRLDFVSTDAAQVFIYLNTTGVDEAGNRIPNFVGKAEAQMMTCALYNASYDAHFEVKSTGAQFTTSPMFEN
ncbi:hypothetical protein AYL99_09424 [Fonsecaea erecta]|uniref:Uncharacterized protein n=1 Tax=Fonsecaea erecta TaxID=1367422 RepID=A0A178ZAX7_9EURO|nr:hypothetical protein AYL99_09424 [Fonsecaea erecta]OAP56245.1 hypothetical protein AYL99_09424 [Fonsecaea erecta]